MILLIDFNLSFRAFGVWCDNIEADPTLEHSQRSTLEEYRSKLITEESVILPDPLELKTGWVGEETGITKWPSVYYIDISRLMGVTNRDFIHRMETEYKQGKAYRYFHCDFVREIFYHSVDTLSPFCILKCRVVPSQRVNNKPYDVWAIILKDKGDTPSGTIISSYCTCTAGLLGTCNHVIAMLFRVEAAVTSGVTNPSKTSVPCQWNIPTGKKPNLKPKAIRELVFDKGHYTKSQFSKEKLTEDKKQYLSFSPGNKTAFTSSESKRLKLFELLKDDVPASCFIQLMGKTTNVTENEATPETLHLSIKSIFETRDIFEYNENISLHENIN